MVALNSNRTLIADPEVLKVPIVESGENLVDLRDMPALRYGQMLWIANSAEAASIGRLISESEIIAARILV